MLDALEHDANPGVRVAAVNVLVGSLEKAPTGFPEIAPSPGPLAPKIAANSSEEDPSVERVVRVLEQLQHRDPSRYVRLRSAAALRQIGPREVQ